jgi:mono/diheme cytochrome c family protein
MQKVIITAILALSLGGCVNRSPEGEVFAGKVIALESCAACHQVDTSQAVPRPVRDPDQNLDVAAPSFKRIARLYNGDRASLRRYIQAPHYPMREQQWSGGDLDAVVAFITDMK